jgi:hypothetical protein
MIAADRQVLGRYTGEFEGSLRHGEGVYQYRDGAVYEGGFRCGRC